MKKLIFLALLGMVLTSCSYFHVHKVEVEQGNYMDSNKVNSLHVGMSMEKAKAIMGEPILVNIINPRVESYVYTFQVGAAARTEKKVTLVFDHGILQNIQREGI